MKSMNPLFVDYSGHTMELIDGLTGELLTAQIFVAVLGASNYTYAEATFTQSLPDWIASHVRAFAYFGRAARQTISDNLKADVTRACFHEPMVNRTYADLAAITAPPYRQHAHIIQRTNPKLRWGYKSLVAGFWRG
jgi:transposase